MMKFLIVFLATTPLFGGTFEILCKDHESGKYQNILDEIHFLYEKWEEEGALADFFRSRRLDPRDLQACYKDKLARYKKSETKLKNLEDKRNERLMQAIANVRDERIGRVVQKVVKFSELSREFAGEVDFLALLAAGGVDTYDNSSLLKIEKILKERDGKSYLLHSLLLSNKFDLATYELYSALVSLEAVKKIAPHCPGALKVEEVRLSLAFDQKFLSDLLVGLRGPESRAEEQVKEILRTYQAERELATKQ